MLRQIIVMFCSLLALLLSPVAAHAENSGTRHGALFKIEQSGRTLYLFGTIHVGAADFYPLEPQLAQLLEQAPVLALEIDPLGDQQALAKVVQRYGMQGRGGNAPTLSASWRLRLERLLREYHIEANSVAAMKPWLLASVLTISEFSNQGYSTALAVDAYLSKQAHKRGQKVVELESAESQMALFDSMGGSQQLIFLQEAIAGIESREQASQARAIGDAWRHADAAALEELASKAEQDDSHSGRFVQKVLLEGRNPGLADGMQRLMQQADNAVAAVGILHLVGQYSVPELLRKRGLKVERLY
ncbi:TraB/GumN family protein [Pseudoduganella danionis]|nr:TraB/GumN family protein [Pseudoduganella danionis]